MDNIKAFTKSLLTFLVFWLAVHPVAAQSLSEAEKLLSYDRTEEAITMLKSLGQASPADVPTNFALGKALLNNGDRDGAIAVFQQLASGAPNTAGQLLGAAQILILNGNAAGAKANLDKTARLAKKDAVLMRIIGESLLLGDKPDPTFALTFLEKARSMAKTDPAVYKAMADAYDGQNNAGKAVTQWEYVMQYAPNDPIPHYEVGKIWQRAKNSDMAIASYTKASALDPKFINPLRRIRDLYYDNNQWAGTLEVSEKIVATGYADFEDWRPYVEASYFSRNWDTLVRILPGVIEKYPDENYLWRLLGYAQFEKSNYQAALDAMNTFFPKQDPEKILVSDYDYTAKIYERLGADSTAATYYEKVVEMEPETRKDLNGAIASIYFKKRKWDKAGHYFLRKIQTSPEVKDQDVLLLGYCYFYEQKYPQADSTFGKVAEMRPDLPAAPYWQGYTKQIQEDNHNRANKLTDEMEGFKIGAAKASFDKFIELAQADPTKYKSQFTRAYRYLISYYGVQKDLDNTKAYINKYLAEIDPNNAFYKELLGNLNQYGFQTTVQVPKTPTTSKTPAGGKNTSKTNGKGK
ncbi:MAG: tetratricopeptide repeat protein [Rhodothermia bacterium]|nr:tetratricopeptide repeat protein [Rhodothermia bacterium]